MKCQEVLALLDGNYGGIRIHNLITIGAANMLVSDSAKVSAADNLNVDYHPYWSQITVFDPKVNTEPDPPSNCIPGPDQNPTVPPGHYPPQPLTWEQRGTHYQGYFVLVNGSPYNWKVTYQHLYQMDTWAWIDIPAGNKIRYFAAVYYI